ncbi:MAG: M17 family peptidase N-terminal domain-containing protein, partial [Planctomycetota bacterium]|nr:M17 family peptidase N-terminal domain-containing protein [Planctomycetota bacterium]
MRVTTTNPTRVPHCPVTISFCLEGKRPELPAAVKLASGVRGDFSGKFREVRLGDDLAPKNSGGRVMLVGLGKGQELTTERLRRAAAIAAKKAEKLGAAKAAAMVPAAVTKLCGGPGEVATALAEGAVMGAYRNTSSKSKPSKSKLRQLILAGTGTGFGAGAKRGLALGEANCFARELQNAPANLMTPRDLAKAARSIARKGDRISARIMDEKVLAKEKMGLFLSVSRGSVEPARLIHLVYKPKGKSLGRIALVGKGLTFDSGGISIKPSGGMEDMRYDMSGSAAVLGVFEGLTSLDVKYEVHGLVVACENMPDGKASKPGDVQTAMDGTTVEIINTDAEGRLALADGLLYTRKHIKPDTIIDLATLTGAVVM